MRKIFSIISAIFLILVLLGLEQNPVLAKKRIGSGTRAVGVSGGITISPKLRKDRKALEISFSNINNAFSFSYELTYLADGIEQGVYGTVTPKPGETFTSRELLFGTCSHGVCRYHQNLQNMRFTVTTSLRNGKKTIHKYRVKP